MTPAEFAFPPTDSEPRIADGGRMCHRGNARCNSYPIGNAIPAWPVIARCFSPSASSTT